MPRLKAGIAGSSSVVLSCFIILAPAPTSFSSEGSRPTDHRMTLTIVPAAHVLRVRDTVTFPTTRDNVVSFLLHSQLHARIETPEVILIKEETNVRPSSIDPTGRYTPQDDRVPVTRYRVHIPPGIRTFTLSYEGQINQPPIAAGDDYGRSTEDSAGVISSDGVFLSGSSYWYPTFEDQGVLSFTLDVEGPDGFRFVSQGKRREYSRDNHLHQVWYTDTPQDEIYLVGGKWVEYAREEGDFTAYAFLRSADQALAEKYLSRTGPYVRMYEALLGPYPYPKFALVENFWETGYGMPSFTLLGSTVVRLPFILTSSYPHEILHNWWGNGVYVDYREGNWCEGLTAYLADHLMAENRGEGTIYRRTTLKHYADYVTGSQDFPISAFRERHNAVTRAVGYGKTLMLFHMLRLELGDQRFIEALRTFYQENRFKRASFSLLADTFSRVAGSDLRPFFAQWVQHTGAPVLQVKQIRVEQQGKTHQVRARLEQIQGGTPYHLRVPVFVTGEGGAQAQMQLIVMNDRETEIIFTMSSPPIRLDIDPEFDVFRRLDRAELPPTLSEAFGDSHALFVLPAQESPELLEGYRRLATAWKVTMPDAQIRLDQELEALPQDRAVWVLGWNNRFRREVERSLTSFPIQFTEKDLTLDSTRISPQSGSVVITSRFATAPFKAIGFVATETAMAIPGLSRKVPHYDRYSYLAFTGEETKNILKGEWPVISSPLSIPLGGPSLASHPIRPPRKPLIAVEP
ncbi:MAG: M1 family peptidase [Nitrospira sp.]|nr:M1 family peptidase [Nitrospira sp.]